MFYGLHFILTEYDRRGGCDDMEADKRRVCRRCLTRDMDKDVYFENLHTYIRNLEENLKVDETLYEERLSRCKECDLLMDGMCRACGCYVELRAVMKKNSCPYDKWTGV